MVRRLARECQCRRPVRKAELPGTSGASGDPRHRRENFAASGARSIPARDRRRWRESIRLRRSEPSAESAGRIYREAGCEAADRRRSCVHRIPLRAALKKIIFRFLGKDPEAIIVSFASGDPQLAARMLDEIQALEPRRRHVLVRPEEASSYPSGRRLLSGYRIGLAPGLFDAHGRYGNLRRIAFLLAPTKILAYNKRLERHHLRFRTVIASLLFLKGVPLDRIFLRPNWLVPWKRDRSLYPS